MPLTDEIIKNAQVGHRPYRITDGKGLSLYITVKGSKYWRFDYRYMGKRKTLHLGTYPKVSLTKARHKLDRVRKMINQGIDPGFIMKIQKQKIKKRKDKLKNLVEIQVLRAFKEGYKLACIMHSPSGYDEHCELELIEALETFEKMIGQMDDDS